MQFFPFSKVLTLISSSVQNPQTEWLSIAVPSRSYPGLTSYLFYTWIINEPSGMRESSNATLASLTVTGSEPFHCSAGLPDSSGGLLHHALTEQAWAIWLTLGFFRRTCVFIFLSVQRPRPIGQKFPGLW